MFGKRYPNCVKKTKKEELEVETSYLDEKKKYQGNPFKKKPGIVDKAFDKFHQRLWIHSLFTEL